VDFKFIYILYLYGDNYIFHGQLILSVTAKKSQLFIFA